MSNFASQLRRAVSALVFVAAGMATGASATPPPAEAFFQDPMLDEARLSPDGRSLAIRVSAKGAHMRIAVLDLQTLKPKVVAAFDEGDVGTFAWVNDKRLVYDLNPPLTGPSRIDDGPGLFAVNADGSGFRKLVDTEGFMGAADAEHGLHWRTSLLSTKEAGIDHEVFVARPGEVSRDKVDYLELQRLNTLNGRAETVDTPLHAFGWTFDAQGELRVVVTQRENRKTVLLRDAKGGWKPVAEFENMSPQSIYPRYMDAEGRLYAEARSGNTTAVFTMDTATGELSKQPFVASPDFDLHPSFITREGKLVGLRYNVDAEVTQWLTPELRALQATIDELLPITANRVSVPKHGDSPWVLVQAEADVQPRLTYLYNTETRKLTRVGASLPSIDPRQMSRTEFIHYPARDGLQIPAYLTLPKGAPKTGLPLVVLVHGGPFVRGSQWQWDPEVQFLASRGYAVLQPEFRGSTGYGSKLFSAGFKQWGQAMQDDLADGARWAIAQGTVDAKRICIAGASYGGYATLMGLKKNPELFRCGIDWVGVTDIGLLFSSAWSDISAEAKKYDMRELIGDPSADAAMFKANSPVEQAAQIRQPVLMAYGAWDTRVPVIHGERFRDAVKPYNSQVEWLVYPKEGHGWATQDTKLDFWGRVERFLARHLAASSP